MFKVPVESEKEEGEILELIVTEVMKGERENESLG